MCDMALVDEMVGHTKCDDHNVCDGYNCYITFLDILGLSERPGTLT